MFFNTINRFRWFAMFSLGLAIGLSGCGRADIQPEPARSEMSSGNSSGDEFAIAFGRHLDSPPSPAAVGEGLRIAERLRRHYGIDTGHRRADYLAAAQRAKKEILDPLRFQRKEIEVMASTLGYSLDRSLCETWCDNVERLAIIELQKQALQAFLEHGDRPLIGAAQ